VRVSFQGAVVRYTVNSEEGGGTRRGRTEQGREQVRSAQQQKLHHIETETVNMDDTLERMRCKATPMTDPEDVMRVVQGVIFNQPDEAMHECSLDHRPSLYPTGPSDRDKGISNQKLARSTGIVC
jgi:hypothetical protein